MPYPTVSARMRAPRRRACSSSSSTRMPDPSPTTKPSRLRSQGREARWGSSLRVESARMAANPPIPMGVMQASVPPQIMTSASPRWMSRKESPMECELVVQAVAVAEFGPFAPAGTAMDEREGVANGMRAGSTGSGGGRIRTLRPGADGDVAGGEVDDGRRNEERRDAAGTMLEQRQVFALDDFESADAAADVDAHILGLGGVHAQAGGTDGAIRRRDGELDEAPHLLDFFFFDVAARIESFDLAGDPAGKEVRGEGRDRSAAAFTRQYALPGCFGPNAYGGHQAHTGYDHSA